ncbi:MAG: hypothetical protein AB1805_02045 [Nitrospirota bacterium]
MRSGTRHKERHLLLFTLYFLVVALFPFSHCHAGEGLSVVHPEQAECTLQHLFFPQAELRCCELHSADSHSRDDHHVHFLVSDSNAPIRPNSASPAPLPLQVAVAVDTASTQPIQSSFFSSIQKPSQRPHEGFSTSFSGLSPPVV